MPRTIIVLLTLAALSIAAGAAHAQIACEAPQETELTAGVADNFAPPTEPASPSAELAAFLAPHVAVFDHTQINRWFGPVVSG